MVDYIESLSGDESERRTACSGNPPDVRNEPEDFVPMVRVREPGNGDVNKSDVGGWVLSLVASQLLSIRRGVQDRDVGEPPNSLEKTPPCT